MTTTDRRYPMKVEVQDGLDRDAELSAGVADGRGKFLLKRLHEDGEADAVLAGFSVNPSACRDLKKIVDAMCEALNMRGQS